MAALSISVADALASVLAGVTPLPPEEATLGDACDRILATDLKARRTQPPADASAMDGYAVRAADVTTSPVHLEVIGEIAAGRLLDREVGPGQAARIFTGGMMPPGADTVVIQENTTRQDAVVTVLKPVAPGHHIRRKGLDFTEGTVLLDKGRRLSVRDIGLAASMNHPVVPVHRRPRMAVLSTGDELILPGQNLSPGQIVSSNAYMLAAIAAREGAVALDLGIAPDRLDATTAAVRRARDAHVDILVTSGGASVGDYDFVQRALMAEGVELSFWKVALRPGRPLMHGHLDGMQVLGVPGNPVAAFTCATLFLVPLLRRLAGHTDTSVPVARAVLGCTLPANDERAEYMRATLSTTSSGTLVANPFAKQDSSMMVPLTKAGCLIIRAPFAPAADVGDACEIIDLQF